MSKQQKPLITYKKKPNNAKEIDHILHPLVKKWFYSRFKSFSLPQKFGVMEIHSRQNILVSAPTGATKTLTGFLSILNELIDLEKKADGGAALILTSHAGYFAQQPLSYISNICKKHNCLLIEDASPAVGDKELCNGDYSDIIVASFGEHKPVNNCYGGFISVKNQEFFADSSTIFSTTNFNPRNPEALLKKLADVPNRLDRFYALQEKVKTELEGLGFKILHRDKKGLNVMVKPMTDEEKTRLLDYCKKKKFEFVQCPKYIRLEEDAISIELKRLNI